MRLGCDNFSFKNRIYDNFSYLINTVHQNLVNTHYRSQSILYFIVQIT